MYGVFDFRYLFVGVCTEAKGRCQVPSGMLKLFFDTGLILYWLGWKPATSSSPPVSALPELGLQDCAGEPVSYLGAGIQVPVMAFSPAYF